MPRAVLMFFSLFLASSAALAQVSSKYYGITIGGSEYKEAGYAANMPTITGRLGYEKDYRRFRLGGEARLGYGHKGSFNNVDIQMNWFMSALGKASWQAIERVFLTVYGGYTVADTKATTSVGSSKITDNTFSYGVSIDLYANERHGLNFEWIRLLDGTMRGADYTVDYIGLGYFSRF